MDRVHLCLPRSYLHKDIEHLVLLIDVLHGYESTASALIEGDTHPINISHNVVMLEVFQDIAKESDPRTSASEYT
jgi:hypothetical protein